MGIEELRRYTWSSGLVDRFLDGSLRVVINPPQFFRQVE